MVENSILSTAVVRPYMSVKWSEVRRQFLIDLINTWF